MRKLKISSLFLGLFTAVAFTSCDEGGNPDAGGTTTQEFAGDWHIVGLDPVDGTPAFGGDYYLWSTYNASSNDENFWIDDHDTFFELKAKAQANISALTFESEPNTLELYLGGTVNIINGKILKNAATSFGGHEVDSIYFECEFDWDPGNFYKFGGHKRTGFLEDEL